MFNIEQQLFSAEGTIALFGAVPDLHGLPGYRRFGNEENPMVPALAQMLKTTEIDVLKLVSQGAPMAGILDELCKLIDARIAGVFPAALLLDSERGHLWLATGPTVSAGWNASVSKLSTLAVGCFESVKKNLDHSLAVTDMTLEPLFADCWELVMAQGMRAAWSVPIWSKDEQLLGTFLLFFPRTQRLSPEDLKLMELCVHMATIAVESRQKEDHLREFSRRLYKSQDEERRRIARELHDSTGQKVAALGMNLSAVKNTLSAQSGETLEVLMESISLTRSITDELRTLSYLLHPPLLDECGLNTAIAWYVNGINQRNGLHVEVEIPDELLRLTDEAELAIFRIVQASLTNVHLHSKAHKATVRIEQGLDGVSVSVSDDGQGIPDGVMDHTSRIKTVGIGITGMRERVKQLGGQIEIESGRSGTTVSASVPGRHFRNMVKQAAEQTGC